MKYFTQFTLFSVLLAVALFAVLPGMAQTHTPKYVSMAARTKGYYEYLPAGYDPNGTTRHPLLLFITGVGEFGKGNATDLPKVLKNGVPKLINAGTFPTSFTVNGQTHRFIVITPQFITSPRPVASDIEAVLNYIVAHYKVDTTRMYITGLSYGGGIAWAHPGDNAAYAKRIAATAPVASAAPLGGDSAIYARSRTIADHDVPVWAFHNNGDSTAPVTTTNSYISYINQAPAPTPLAKKTIFTSNGHDAWTKAYNPATKEDGLNVYEWMLQFKRNPHKAVQVNIYGGANPYNNTAWNNWNIGTAEASNITSTAFKYSDGTASAVTATLSHTRPIVDNGATYGGGIAPAEVLRYTTSSNLTRTLTLKGLATDKTYSLEVYASRGSSTAGSTVFTVSGKSVTINTVNNRTNKATFANIAPSTSGQIVVSITKANTYSYINGFALVENGTVSYTKYVKTNIYGGNNPYNNAAWNDWNIGTVEASNINSAALKYSDGSTSTISATLSHTRPIVDNGSTYGSGGMAPAQVLRYTSSSTLTRTLTIKGLSTSKTYSLELYASRGSSTAGNTVFTVNGTSQTINTVNNLSNKASFNNLTPTSSGQIVVSITKANTYSYINGFTIAESSGGASAPVSALEMAKAHIVTEQPVSPAIKVHPNPAADAVWLTVANAYAGAVQVQLADATGKVCRTYRFVKGAAVLRQSLPVNGLAKGLYFVVVLTGDQRQTLPIFKQ